MCDDLVTATVIAICKLEGIQLHPKLGCQIVQEGLSLDICIERRALRTAGRLCASNIVTIFVINVNAIKLLIVYNTDQICGKLFFLAKTVIPTVIWIICGKKVG